MVTNAHNSPNTPDDDGERTASLAYSAAAQVLGLLMWMSVMLAHCIYWATFLGIGVNVFRRVTGI